MLLGPWRRFRADRSVPVWCEVPPCVSVCEGCAAVDLRRARALRRKSRSKGLARGARAAGGVPATRCGTECLGKTRNFLPIRPRHAVVSTDVGAAVRPRHAGDSWLNRARSALKRIDTSYQRPPAGSHITSDQPSRGTKPPIFWHLACKRKPPRMCWSGCSLLVDDLKAAVALLSSVVVEASFQRSQTIVFDVPCMHHACSD